MAEVGNRRASVNKSDICPSGCDLLNDHRRRAPDAWVSRPGTFMFALPRLGSTWVANPPSPQKVFIYWWGGLSSQSECGGDELWSVPDSPAMRHRT